MNLCNCSTKESSYVFMTLLMKKIISRYLGRVRLPVVESRNWFLFHIWSFTQDQCGLSVVANSLISLPNCSGSNCLRAPLLIIITPPTITVLNGAHNTILTHWRPHRTHPAYSSKLLDSSPSFSWGFDLTSSLSSTSLRFISPVNPELIPKCSYIPSTAASSQLPKFY